MLYVQLRSKLLCERASRRFRSFDAACEGSVLRLHTYVPAGFRHFPHESARNSCLDSSARNLADNHSGIVRKIRALPRGYPRPSAPENRGISRKNVSFPCQVPYIKQPSST